MDVSTVFCHLVINFRMQIMKSYESSTATLKSILSHPSLQREKIEETMDAMASASQDAQEIDETIRLNGELGDQSVDEQELEDELKMLVAEAEEEKRQATDTLQIERLHKEREAATSSETSRNQVEAANKVHREMDSHEVWVGEMPARQKEASAL